MARLLGMGAKEGGECIQIIGKEMDKIREGAGNAECKTWTYSYVI